MTTLRLSRCFAPILAGSLALALAGAAPAWAASSGPVLLAQQDAGDDQGDASGLVLRISRLEEQIRSLTGQVEQLQFQNRQLGESLKKMQGDVDFRLQDLEHPAGGAVPRPAAAQKRGDADTGRDPGKAFADLGSATASAAPLPDTVTPSPTRRTSGDAFDPDANPTAPGAPKPLGSTTPSQPLETRSSRQAGTEGTRGPLDLMRPQAAATPSPAAGAAVDLPAAAPADSVASLTPGGTREEYDADLSLFKQGQYDGAASSFQAFADKYPKDRLVPDAIYLAGESYFRLGRQREAAEQFLKVSTDYGKSSRAPDALLKLGMSLNALGAKEQACATYGEVTRRYPNASADVRTGVDRELKRARCPANG